MPRKLTDEEHAFAADVFQKIKALDYEFIAKDVASKLVTLPYEDKLGYIIGALQLMVQICVDASSSEGQDAVDHIDVDVDETIDRIREFMETALTLTRIADLITNIAESDEDEMRDYLKPDKEGTNKRLEQIRTKIIRSRIGRELRNKRRR